MLDSCPAGDCGVLPGCCRAGEGGTLLPEPAQTGDCGVLLSGAAAERGVTCTWR